jgi:anti-sigma factor RsiW
MTCDEEALTEYLDGELTPERLRAVEAHLAGCPACVRTLGRLKAASKAFKKHAAVPPAKGLLKGPGRETRGRELSAVLTAVIVAVVVVLSVGKMFKPQISGIFNQVMGMISGAASTVGSGN